MNKRKRPTEPQRKLIKRKEVEQLTQISPSTIYKWMGQGRFPQSVRVGPRTVRWHLDEILHYIKTRPRSR